MLHFRKIIFILLLLPLILNAQNDILNISNKYLQGYHKSISGGTINYHSPLPNVNSALLARANETEKSIEWETEVVPKDIKKKFVSFIWMFGIDVNSNSCKFDFYINDSKWFTFKNPQNTEQKNWTISAKKGAQLIFNASIVDRHSDLMGYSILKIPASVAESGKPLKLKVVGESAESMAWYMTFESSLEEKISIQSDNLLLRGKNQKFQLLRLNVSYFSSKTEATISLNNGLQKSFELSPGFNSITFKIPEVKKVTIMNAEIRIGNRPIEKRSVEIKPVRKWTINFVQHTHTDIGYTRPQSDILPEHLRFIDFALDYCDQTDHFPDDAKFRWNCESSWPVREYLKRRPAEQIKRLKQRVDEGRIELMGMFFNMSEILDENLCAAQLQPIRLFLEFELPVQAAMQNDVNGIGWCLADYFSGIGIKYLIMGEHGHRALIPFDKPTPFWWESPSGKRVLAFRADHYMTGNFLNINVGPLETIESSLLKYLDDLKKKDYPFDNIAIQYSGHFTDNSPPGLKACEMIKEWNEKYEWPKLRSATASEFMEYIEKNHGEELPAFRVAWPDWWTDGFGSAARETAAARKTQSEMTATMGLLSMALMLGADISENTIKNIEAIQDANLFYDEHTYGAAESIRDPQCRNSVEQWAEKSSYVWEAVKKSRILREEAKGLIQSYLPKAEVPTITIFNTLNWERSGLSEVYIDHEILPKEKSFRIVDENGNEIMAQPLRSRSDGTYWGLWAEDVPPMGYKIYRIQVNEEIRKEEKKINFAGKLENDFYKLVIDQEKGAIKSLFDKEMQQELVDENSKWQLGQFIYERLSNRRQLEKFRLEKAWRTSFSYVRTENGVNGPIWKSLIIHGTAEDCADNKGVTCEIRLYNHQKRIELHFAMRKLAVEAPEAVYVAFPFQLQNGQIIFEAQGGMVIPGKDQLAGTASDWNTVQGFASVRNNNAQIIWGSTEIPLVHFGGLNIGNFDYVSKPKNPHIFSWVLNNYWTTNFKASQQGELNWSYFLTSSKNNSNSFATKFGWGSRVPFLSRVIPAGKEVKTMNLTSLLNLKADNILLVNSKPSYDGKGIIFHLREINGQRARLSFVDVLKNEIIKKVSEINVLEEDLLDSISSLNFEPFETKFVKLGK